MNVWALIKLLGVNNSIIFRIAHYNLIPSWYPSGHEPWKFAYLRYVLLLDINFVGKKIQMFPFSIHKEGEFYHLLFHAALYLMSSFLPEAGQVVGDEQPVVCLLYSAGT